MKRSLLLLIALALLAVPAVAQALTVNEVAREVRCVTCGTTVDISTSGFAAEVRTKIKQEIDQGKTKQQILDDLESQFGRQILATPPKKGFDLVAWLVPGIAVLLGLAAIPFITRAWARRRPKAAGTAVALSDDDRRRVDEALDRLGDA